MRLIRKYYSRHTPSDLESYRKLDDAVLEKLTRGQRLRLLESETDKAERNQRSYQIKKAIKHGLIGAGAGAILGGVLGHGISSGLAGGVVGGTIGGGIGTMRGQYIADKEGHTPEKVSRRVADKLDKYAREHGQEDDYGYVRDSELRNRRSLQEASSANRNTRLLLLDNAINRS